MSDKTKRSLAGKFLHKNTTNHKFNFAANAASALAESIQHGQRLLTPWMAWQATRVQGCTLERPFERC